jgi:uncharacterized protein
MKAIIQDDRRYMLRFDKDEDVIAGLAEYANNNQITAAAFTGIGTSSVVELGFFNAFLKDYRKKPFTENWEIVSLTGNIARAEDQTIVHAHGTFANNEFAVFGGHVFKLVALATCEIYLVKLYGVMNRKNNPEFNLKLLTE